MKSQITSNHLSAQHLFARSGFPNVLSLLTNDALIIMIGRYWRRGHCLRMAVSGKKAVDTPSGSLLNAFTPMGYEKSIVALAACVQARVTL